MDEIALRRRMIPFGDASIRTNTVPGFWGEVLAWVTAVRLGFEPGKKDLNSATAGSIRTGSR